MSSPRRKRYLDEFSMERALTWRLFAMLVPLCVALVIALYATPWPNLAKFGISAVFSVLAIWGGRRLVNQVVYPINTASNLLEALREGDCSLRGTGSQRPGALGYLVKQINDLAENMRADRLRAEEASALLNKVLDEVDVSVLAFDERGLLRLANRAALKMFMLDGKAPGEVHAEQLGLRGVPAPAAAAGTGERHPQPQLGQRDALTPHGKHAQTAVQRALGDGRELDRPRLGQGRDRAGGGRHEAFPGRSSSTVAVCGGSGDSLLGEAAVADAYLTADLRHHPASEAPEGLALIDAAHWATEWPWLADVAARLSAATTVDTVVSTRVTDPWTHAAPSPT